MLDRQSSHRLSWRCAGERVRGWPLEGLKHHTDRGTDAVHTKKRRQSRSAAEQQG